MGSRESIVAELYMHPPCCCQGKVLCIFAVGISTQLHGLGVKQGKTRLGEYFSCLGYS